MIQLQCVTHDVMGRMVLVERRSS